MTYERAFKDEQFKQELARTLGQTAIGLFRYEDDAPARIGGSPAAYVASTVTGKIYPVQAAQQNQASPYAPDFDERSAKHVGAGRFNIFAAQQAQCQGDIGDSSQSEYRQAAISAQRKAWKIAERARILAWLDSMKPGETPYTRSSSELERKASMRMWERMREAIEGGKDAPKDGDAA